MKFTVFSLLPILFSFSASASITFALDPSIPRDSETYSLTVTADKIREITIVSLDGTIEEFAVIENPRLEYNRPLGDWRIEKLWIADSEKPTAEWNWLCKYFGFQSARIRKYFTQSRFSAASVAIFVFKPTDPWRVEPHVHLISSLVCEK
jgi:hypothetical protein